MKRKRSMLDVSKEVRERYCRIRYRRLTERIGRIYSRIVLPLKEQRKNKALDKALHTYKQEAERASKTDNECVKVLMNIGLYYLVAEKDIQSIKVDALTHPDPWRRNLLLRVILLTIYERDMSKVGVGNLKELLNRSNVDQDLQSEMFHALRELRKAQKEAAKLLHDARNSIIAHRDPDALLQLRAIEKLKAKDVFAAAELFYVSSKHFMEAFPKVLLQAGSLRGLFSYMINK